MTYQSIYPGPIEFFKAHPPTAQVNFYLVGDAHSDNKEGEESKASGTYVDVHWNAMVMDKIAKKVVWYDPSAENIGNPRNGYDFDTRSS